MSNDSNFHNNKENEQKTMEENLMLDKLEELLFNNLYKTYEDSKGSTNLYDLDFIKDIITTTINGSDLQLEKPWDYYYYHLNKKYESVAQKVERFYKKGNSKKRYVN